MPWTPSGTLGTVKEFEHFSYSVQYYEEVAGAVDPSTGLAGPSTQTYYPVVVTADIPQPYVVCNSTAADPGTIAGYFQNCFFDTVSFRGFNKDNVTLTTDATTGAWEKLDLNKANYMTHFIPDSTRARTFTYTATAKNGSTVLSTQQFSILVSDKNWTPGQQKLKEAVRATEARRA